MKLLVAIPCFNESGTLAAVIRSTPKAMSGVSQVDVVVIDDGSIDGTAEVAVKEGADVVRHHSNRGVGAAFHSAVNYALEHNYDLMVNIDGDNQFDPKDIPQIIEPILSGAADMATASRFKDPVLTPNMPRVKLVGNHLMSFLISKLCRTHFSDVSCGFRAYSREALLHINLLGVFTYTQETFLDLTSKKLRIVEVPTRVVYFPGRESRVAGRLPRYALNAAAIIFRIYRDYFPLRFFLAISAVFTGGALAFGSIFLGHYLLTGIFSGYLYAGFLAGFFAVIALALVLVAIVVDMLDRIRTNQERILYLLKKRGIRKADD